MTEELERKYKDFVKRIKSSHVDEEYRIEAQALLNEDFKEQVISLYGQYFLKSSYAYEHNRQDIKEATKVEFIKVWFTQYDESKDFLEKHWNEADEIISILKGYIKELETEEAKETQENE